LQDFDGKLSLTRVDALSPFNRVLGDLRENASRLNINL